MIGVASENELEDQNKVSKDKNIVGFATILNINFYQVHFFS